MHIQEEKLTEVRKLLKKHQIVIVGEIHGVKQNVEVVRELVNNLQGEFDLVVGFEYPQSIIDDTENVNEIYFKDGRFSKYHKELVEVLKNNGTELFGFDISGEQLQEQTSMPIDWRDKKMAENINRKLKEISKDKKVLLVCGDIHYQTQLQNFMYPDKDGNMKPTPFLPMAAQIDTLSILAIHLRYLSGSFYNFKLKNMPKIDANKEFSFTDNDDLIEIDISEATPTCN